MPPSSDDLPGRAEPAPKRAKNSGRKRGKQPGAKGSAMPWVSVPDEQVPHRPRGHCGCGMDLADAHDVGIERSHQVHDLPEVHIKVSQHDVYRVRCACGAEHLGSLLGEVSAAPASYEVNLKTLVVYLLIYQHVPVQRCVRLIADLTGGTGPLGRVRARHAVYGVAAARMHDRAWHGVVCVAEHADEKGRLASLSCASEEAVSFAIAMIKVVTGLESGDAVGGLAPIHRGSNSCFSHYLGLRIMLMSARLVLVGGGVWGGLVGMIPVAWGCSLLILGERSGHG